MAQFTTTIRSMCEYYARQNNISYNYSAGAYNLCFNVGQYIFPNPMPFYTDNEEVRKNFMAKFLLTYFNEEIGQETVALFRISLESDLNRIMPYYTELFKTMLTNPNENMTDYSMDETSSSNSSSTGNTENKNYVSDYPINTVDDIGSNNYLTTGQQNTQSNTSKGTGKSEAHREGRNRSKGMLLAEYRDLIVNIDERIIDELSHLFMSTWITPWN